MRGKQPPLIFQEFVDEPGPALDCLIPVPGSGYQQGNQQKQPRVPPTKEKPEPVVDIIDSQRQQEDHQGDLPLGQDRETHEDPGQYDIINFGPVDPRLIIAIPFPMIKDKKIKREKSKQIEPGVDDPGFEIHIREKRSAKGQRPQQTELPIEDPGSAEEDG